MEVFLPHTQEYMVMKILAIDLGKYKSVACNYVTATGTARFATVVTHVQWSWIDYCVRKAPTW